MKRILIVVLALFFIACGKEKKLVITKEMPIPRKTMKGDNYIFLDDIIHEPTKSYIYFDREKDELSIILKGKGEDISEATLVVDGKEVEMESLGIEMGREIFQGTFKLGGEGREITYYFKLRDHKFTYLYGKKSGYELGEVVPFELKIDDEMEGKIGDSWYYILIDRFRNKDEDNDPIFSAIGPEYYDSPSGEQENGTPKYLLTTPTLWGSLGDLEAFQVTPWTQEWDKDISRPKEGEKYGLNSNEKYYRRYGGDLEGIEEKIDYLKDLGVQGVILSPPLYSYSSFKFDTIDFGHISPDLAILDKDSYIELEKELPFERETKSDQYFKNLVGNLHQNNIKVMMELNFEYVSKRFFPYREYLKDREESKYKDWFIDGDRDKEIVYLNLKNKELQDYLIARTLKWFKGDEKGIDGLYLKGETLDDEFIQKLESQIKEVGKDPILVMEKRSALGYKQSYRTGKNLNSIRLNKKEWEKEVKGYLNTSRYDRYDFNFLDSLDTNRYYSSIVNRPLKFDRENNGGRDGYNNQNPEEVDKFAPEKLILGAVYHLTTATNPVILYGDEQGLWGGDFPDNTKPMKWKDILGEKDGKEALVWVDSKEGKEDIVREEYKKILELRKFSPLLFKEGSLEVLDIEDGIGYIRRYKGKELIILLNNSDDEETFKFKLDEEGEKDFSDFKTGERIPVDGGRIKLTIPPYGYKALYREIGID